MVYFQTRGSSNIISWSILLKKHSRRKFQIFDQNRGLTPIRKPNIATMLNCFYSPGEFVF